MEKLVLGQRENSYVKVICLGFTIFCGLKVTSQAESKKRALPVISIIFMLSLSFFPKFLPFFFFLIFLHEILHRGMEHLAHILILPGNP